MPLILILFIVTLALILFLIIERFFTLDDLDWTTSTISFYLCHASLFVWFLAFANSFPPFGLGSITATEHLQLLGHGHGWLQILLEMSAHMLLQTRFQASYEYRKHLLSHVWKALLQFLQLLYVTPEPTSFLQSVQLLARFLHLNHGLRLVGHGIFELPHVEKTGLPHAPPSTRLHSPRNLRLSWLALAPYQIRWRDHTTSILCISPSGWARITLSVTSFWNTLAEPPPWFGQF